MKILFYLPVLTQAWLERGVKHLIEIAARDAEVHVIVPALWLGTGLDASQFESCSQIPGTTWHLLDRADHPSIRTEPSDPRALLSLVKAIAPDYTICRSADVKTPCAFPGKVSFLMEADYPPLPSRNRMRLSGPAIFFHGAMPVLNSHDRALFVRQLQPIRQALPNPAIETAARDRFFAQAGIPSDYLVVGMPLEHDGADNFFMRHSSVPLNRAFIREVAAGVSDRCVLALTLHPAQRSDPIAMEQLASICGERVRILENSDGRDLTPALSRHCDGMVFRDSKSIIWAGLFEKPFYRLSRFESGAWLRAYGMLSDFNDALQVGLARHPDREQALLWLGFHLANNAFDPTDPDLTLARLIDRIEKWVNPERWPGAIERAKADIAAAAVAIETAGV